MIRESFGAHLCGTKGTLNNHKIHSRTHVFIKIDLVTFLSNVTDRGTSLKGPSLSYIVKERIHDTISLTMTYWKCESYSMMGNF